MNICKALAIIVRLFLTIILIATPLFAQRRRAPAPKPHPPAPAAQPATTFDSVLAAESYRIYVEVRGVGQLLRSPGVNDILDPMVKLTSPPKEFKTLVKWLHSQADDLMSSRFMVASMPSRPKLPQVLFVIEFDSAEEAQKFEPKLKGFLPELMPPAPAATTEPAKTSTQPTTTPAEPGKISGEPKVVNEEAKPQVAAPASPPPQMVIKQAGPLLLLSDTAVSLKALRPTGSKPLTEDSNFRQAHSRFSSDSVFLYVDIASFEREDQERRKAMEEEEKKRIEAESQNAKKAEEEVALPEEQASPEPGPDEPPPPDDVVSDPAVIGANASPSPDEPKGQLSGGGGGVSFSPAPLSFLTSFMFMGPPKWPDAVGVALNFEADSYVVRALLINDPETKGSIVPFIPQLVSGPPLSLEASSIFPADTKLLISASLDYTQIYEAATKSMMLQQEGIRTSTKEPIKVSGPESPVAPFEAKLGIKIKDDLLPLLGNEVAISVPISTLGLGLPQPPPQPAASPEKPGDEAGKKAPEVSKEEPVIAIAVKDRESLRLLIPKIIDNIGFKGASLLAQSEKRGDTEFVSYGGVISYAFIGNFLVVSTDSKSIRNVVDSYLNHQTLGSDNRFRDSTRWQPRQMLAQVYMPTELMESYYDLLRNQVAGNNKMRDFLSRLDPTSAPVTYAVSNEGIGPLHELHLPKNFVMFMVAGIVSGENQSPMATNEAVTRGALGMITSAENAYQSGPGKGSFGTLDQLMEQNLVHKDLLEKYGYKIELTVIGAKFEATAVPVEYGKTGVMSFFLDETGVVRGADHGGAPATATDKPIR